jgi:hypothetical protein
MGVFRNVDTKFMVEENFTTHSGVVYLGVVYLGVVYLGVFHRVFFNQILSFIHSALLQPVHLCG